MISWISRRAVLAGGGSLLAASTVGGVWTAAPKNAAEGMQALSALECEVVAALADAFFPGVHFPLSGTQAGVPAAVDRIVAEVLEPVHAQGFRAILRALEWGTVASRGRRFTGLTRSEQLDVLETWTEPTVLPRRVAGDSLKAVLGMAYFAHPDIQAAMGWRVGCGGEAA